MDEIVSKNLLHMNMSQLSTVLIVAPLWMDQRQITLPYKFFNSEKQICTINVGLFNMENAI